MKRKSYLAFYFLIHLIVLHSWNGYSQDTSVSIAVGLRCPDFVFNHLIFYPSDKLSLRELQGKWIILDFWSRYCTACIHELPRLDSIQKGIGNQLIILPVGFEDGEVAVFFKKIRARFALSLPTVVDSSLFRRLKIRSVPFFIWINNEGIIEQIGNDGEDISIGKVKDFMAGNVPPKPLTRQLPNQTIASRDETVDNAEPAVSTKEYISVLDAYKPNQPSHFGFIQDGAHEVKGVNLAILNLYKSAYGSAENKGQFPINRMILNVSDSQRLFDFNNHRNLFCYQLSIPPDATGRLHWIMQQDLDHWFGYHSVLETRKVTCLVLKRRGRPFLLAKGDSSEMIWDHMQLILRNKPISQLVYILWYYMQSDPPIIDETGYKKPIDIELKGFLTEPEDIRNALKRNHLLLKRRKRKITVLVIRDVFEKKVIAVNRK